MSFLRSLFGGGAPRPDAAPPTAATGEHNGFRIEAQPYPEAGQYQVAGTISKVIDGATRTHRFVRADRFATREEAAQFTLTKARQIIDQQGDAIFD